MLLTNPCVNDSRVLREAQALAGAGYDVRVIATQAPGLAPVEQRDGFRIDRLQAEPRLADLIRRAGLAFRRVRSPRATAPPGGEPAADTPAPGVFGDEAWVAAAGGTSDGRLLMRHPRAWALRLGLRVFLALRWWRFARSAWSAIKEEPADLYLAHDLDTLPIAARAASQFGGRLVYDSHELYTDQSVTPRPTRLWRARWRLVETILIQRADAVITVCEGIAEELERRYRIERPRVVRNIPELTPIDGGDHRLREKLGIDPETRIALYLGGIQMNRRLEHFIDAVEPLGEVVLVMMGPGDPAYVARLRDYANQLGMGERVRIVDPVPPELVTAMASDADVGLLVFHRGSLSDWYGLPSKLFESIQAGLPVVASDWPELRRIVQGYGVGLLCDSDQPAAITESLRRLLNDHEAYARMKKNAGLAGRELDWRVEQRQLTGVVEALMPADQPDPRSADAATASR
jgi:glycosyltransferase involved in cell wall biosynthesis